MAKLFAKSGDPDQTPRYTVCQLPFYGSPDYIGLKKYALLKLRHVAVSNLPDLVYFSEYPQHMLLRRNKKKYLSLYYCQELRESLLGEHVNRYSLW